MSYNKYIERLLYMEMPETCPYVDEALEQASEKIKEQTSKFRSVLRQYIERTLTLEEKLEDANKLIKALESQIEDLRYDLREAYGYE